MQPAPKAPSMVTAAAVAMILLAFLHFCGILSVAINLIATLGWVDLPVGPKPAVAAPEQLGQFIGLGMGFVWSIGGLVWAPLNAYGLFKRKAWSRMSTMAYAGVSIATCCCFPFGAFLLYAMLRGDVKAYFGASTP